MDDSASLKNGIVLAPRPLHLGRMSNSGVIFAAASTQVCALRAGNLR
jgi:hypothetical protein